MLQKTCQQRRSRRASPVLCNSCSSHWAFVFLPSVMLKFTVVLPRMKYYCFSKLALFLSAFFFPEVYFPPLSSTSLHLVCGILQGTNCRFPQWPSLFPPVSLRDFCGAQSLYVRPLNEKSVEFLWVQIQLKKKKIPSKRWSKHTLMHAQRPNTSFFMRTSVSSAFKLYVFYP